MMNIGSSKYVAFHFYPLKEKQPELLFFFRFVYVFVIVFLFPWDCAPMLSTASHSDEFHLAEKGGQLLGKLISRKQAEGGEQETRNDPAAKSNNIFIIYFIIHLWMRSDRINNRNPWEKMFMLETLLRVGQVQWHS